MFKRTAKESATHTPPIAAVATDDHHEPTARKTRAGIVQCCLDVSGLSIQDAASRIANQAWHLGLDRLMHAKAETMLRSVLEGSVDLSPFEWNCITMSLVAPVSIKIKAAIESQTNDGQQLERRAAAVRAAISLTKLSLTDVANRVSSAAFHLNVPSLRNGTKERLVAVIERRQDMTDQEWACLKVGVLGGLTNMIREYLESEKCAPMAHPSEDIPRMRRRSRLIRGSMLIAGLDSAAAAKLLSDVAATYRLSDLAHCAEARILDALEDRLNFTEYEWKCFALAILNPARSVLKQFLTPGGFSSEATVEAKRRVALIDGCLIVSDTSRIDAAQGVQAIASRLDSEGTRKLTKLDFERILTEALSPHTEIAADRWKWFRGIVHLASGAIQHEVNEVEASIPKTT